MDDSSQDPTRHDPMKTPPSIGARGPVVQPMMVAYDGSLSAQEAVHGAAAVLRGRRAAILTVWSSVRRAAAATRLALPDEIVAGGVAALDREARQSALRMAEEGARLARAGGLDAAPMETM